MVHYLPVSGFKPGSRVLEATTKPNAPQPLSQVCFVLKRANPGLFFVYFRLFEHAHYNFNNYKIADCSTVLNK